MGRFTKISADAFNQLQLDAGVLLKSFNPSAPGIGNDSNIICATTGGVNPSCVATYSDFAEDIDGAMNGLMEYKHLDSWECKLSTTSVDVSVETIKLALGAADISGTKVTPRRNLKLADFRDLWWVGDKSNGGWAAVKIKNALSTGGFSLQTTKNGKGQIALEITGHVSAAAQDAMPMEFYSSDDVGTGYVSVKQTLLNCTSSFTEAVASTSSNFSAVLTADDGHAITNVIVLMNGEDVTSSKYTSGTHTVAITSTAITGDIEIIATANET